MAEFVLVMWFTLSVAVAYWNHTRGNGFLTALLLSILLSPLIGFIIVVFTKRKRGKRK